MNVYVAFDCATATGVAYGDAGRVPVLETWDLKRKLRGDSALAMMSRCNGLFQKIKPAAAFIEEPLTARVLAEIGTTPNTVAMLQGLPFVVELVCCSLGIPSFRFERQDVLEHFVGIRRFKSPRKGGVKDAAKMACKTRCKQLAWPALDYEQADAAALWDYGIMQRSSKLWLAQQTERPARLIRRA